MKKLPKRKDKKFLFLVLLFLFYFLAKSVFFNQIIYLTHSPDLGYHQSLIELFAKNSKLFFLDESKIIDRDVFTRSDTTLISTELFLYHSLVGRLWSLISNFNGDTYAIVSFIQTIFGFLTLFFAYKLSFLLTRKKYFSLFCAFAVGSIPMFSFLINYLSYDNLVNFISAASIYYLVKFLKSRDFSDLNLLFIYLLAGSITKISYGPLALIIVLILLISSFKERKKYLSDLINYVRLKKYFGRKVLFLFFFVIVSLFYGRNIFVYKSVFPTASSVNGIETSFSIRDKELSEQHKDDGRFGVFKYFINWEKIVEERSSNIVSHKSLIKSSRINSFVHYLLVISFVVLFLKFIFSYRDKNFFLLFIITIFYILFLFAKNYKTYLLTGDIGIATQGRYVFPVLVPLVFLITYSIFSLINNRFYKVVVLSMVAIIFIYLDFIYTLTHFQTWYFDDPVLTNELGNINSLNIGQTSPYQVFTFNNGLDDSTEFLGLYVSTYNKDISDGFVLNLYEGDCSTLIKTFSLNDVSDNQYLVVDFGEELMLDHNYCFNVENNNSVDPITLWWTEENPNLDVREKSLVFDFIPDNLTKSWIFKFLY